MSVVTFRRTRDHTVKVVHRAPEIVVHPSERVLIIGTSGSGKSYLTRTELLPRFGVRPVVFDPKERWEARGCKVVEHFTRRYGYQAIRLPEYDEDDGPDLWNEQAQAVLRNAPRTLVVDELTLCTKPQRLPSAMGRILRTGRDTRGGSVGLWMLTQQPVQIPTACYALSNHKWIFMQEREADIVRIGQETTPALIPFVEGLGKRDYVYYNKERRIIVPVMHVKHRGVSSGR